MVIVRSPWIKQVLHGTPIRVFSRDCFGIRVHGFSCYLSALIEVSNPLKSFPCQINDDSRQARGLYRFGYVVASLRLLRALHACDELGDGSHIRGLL